MTQRIDFTIRAGETFDELFPIEAVDSSRGLRMHIRKQPAAELVQCVLGSDAPANRLLTAEAGGVRVEIGASISSAWIVGNATAVWYFDMESYSLSDEDDVIRVAEGRVLVIPETTREGDVTQAEGYPAGDARYLRFDGPQELSSAQKAQAQANYGLPLERRYSQSGDYQYTGSAPAGAAESESAWTIVRIEYSSGAFVEALTASLVDWTNRATHTYS